jgi:hypothetical protein
MNAKASLILMLVLASTLSFGSIKDPRKNVKLRPELSQSEVSKQQADQKRQGERGIVEQRTDEVDPQSTQTSPEAKSVLSSVKPNSGDDDNSPSSKNVLQGANQDLEASAAAPAKTAMGLFWWLLAAVLLVAGFIYGLNKLAPMSQREQKAPAAPGPKSVKF